MNKEENTLEKKSLSMISTLQPYIETVKQIDLSYFIPSKKQAKIKKIWDSKEKKYIYGVK